MKLLYAFFSFAVVAGGTLVLASPAQAAAGPIYVTVCGDSNTWYVNSDEAGADPKQGDRRPLPTRDGLLFYPKDLIHRVLDFQVTPDLAAGIYTTFPGSPAPDLPDFFSIEVWDDPNFAGYATLRWYDDGTTKQWEVKPIGDSNTYTGTDPKKLLQDHSLSIHGRSFGVGYTNSPPGTAVSLVTSISFMTTVYRLLCSIAASPSPVPGPTKTVIKIVTETPSPSQSDPALSHASSDQPTVSIDDSTQPTFHLTPEPTPIMVNKGMSAVGWGGLLAFISGVGLMIWAIAGIRRRRKYQAAHSVDNSETTTMSAVGDDDYNVYDYNPKAGYYDPALGGHAGETTLETQSTDEIPPVSEGDTKPQPPVE